MDDKTTQSEGRRKNGAVPAFEMTKGVGDKGPSAYPATGGDKPGRSAQRSRNRTTKEG